MPIILIAIPTLGRSTVEVLQVPHDPTGHEIRRIFESGVLDTPAELEHVLCDLSHQHPRPDLAVFYGPFGGMEMPGPLAVDDEVLARIKHLQPRAPTTLPALGQSLRACASHMPDVPCVFEYGSGFFAGLPEAERLYAIEPTEGRRLGLERTGFHGLFHASAVAQVSSDSDVRTLSICLESNPEAAAILGKRPMTVTGGATPLEGLPGQTTCGEIDPGMVLILAKEQHWSPEQIAESLTRQSGLLGLVGRPITVGELFADDSEETLLARNMILYRLLLTAGMAIATLGGLDRIVFTGRHVAAGDVIGPWLCNRLPGAVQPRIKRIDDTFMDLIVQSAIRHIKKGSREALA